MHKMWIKGSARRIMLINCDPTLRTVCSFIFVLWTITPTEASQRTADASTHATSDHRAFVAVCYSEWKKEERESARHTSKAPLSFLYIFLGLGNIFMSYNNLHDIFISVELPYRSK